VTKPDESIVATAVFNENQGVVAVIAAGGTEAVNCVVVGPGKQILKLPVITVGNNLLEFLLLVVNLLLTASFFSMLLLRFSDAFCAKTLWYIRSKKRVVAIFDLREIIFILGRVIFNSLHT
jgi:hypothetical protein